MELREYEVMARVEADHWWHRGLRDVVGRTLGSPRFALPANPRVLDAGCGTGESLRFLGELLSPSYLGGFDSAEAAVAVAREKAPRADIYRSDICDPTLHVDELDLLVSLDVIYIPGAERALDGLRSLVSRLRPGGLLVLNLPAYDWLFSEHDLALSTSQRFTTRRVASLLGDLGLAVELLTYRLCFLFPAVVLRRLPGIWKLRHRGDRGPVLSELHSVPGERANRLLFGILRGENRLIARGVRLPWGSSVFAIGRKL